MTLQQLRYFITLGQYLHFGEAAKACFISQPSLSQSITDLETELNLKLLDRSSRRVELTPAGKVFYSDAQEIIKNADEAIIRARRADSGLDGAFKIGTLGGLSSVEFLTTIADFKNKYKTIDIMLMQSNMKSLNMGLLQGSLDVALTREFDIIHHSQELMWATLFQSRYGIVLRKDHPLAQCDTIQLPELKDEPFILVDKDVSPNAYNVSIQICTSRGLEPRILYTEPTLEIVCALVKAGMGISVQPDCALTYGEDKLKFIPIEGEDTYSDVVLAWRRRNMNPIVPLFLEEFELEIT